MENREVLVVELEREHRFHFIQPYRRRRRPEKLDLKWQWKVEQNWKSVQVLRDKEKRPFAKSFNCAILCYVMYGKAVPRHSHQDCMVG